MGCSHDLEQLRSILKQQMPHLRGCYGVESLGLFGSRVRGDANADSDLDILLSFKEVPGLLRLVELENQLSDLLGLRVDLALADCLKPNIGKQILSELVPL